MELTSVKSKIRKNKINLSVIIAVKDEEKMIKACLESVGWADEILVVDMESTDNTADIAQKSGAKVIKCPWKGYDYGAPRNLGLKNSKGRWLLYLDADERVTLELKDEIQSTINNLQSNDLVAFAIPRRNFILGKEFKHCGQWPDYVKRLFKKATLKKWTGILHEEPNYIFEGKLTVGNGKAIGYLVNTLIHIKPNTIFEMVNKTNSWSEIEAKLLYESGHPPMNIIRFFTAGVREFWLRMIKQGAFLDGGKGFIYALYQVFSRLVSYTKLWELQNEAPLTNASGIFSARFVGAKSADPLRQSFSEARAKNSSHSSTGLWFDSAHHPEPVEGRPRFSAKADKDS
jgi:glycosyltransferase involved in cell wall biosynthesis